MASPSIKTPDTEAKGSQEIISIALDTESVLGIADSGKPRKDPIKWSQAVEPIISKTLQVHPACLEFAPANISSTVYPPSIREFARESFVVGTYQLTEEVKDDDGKNPTDDGYQKRVGGVSLFRLQGHKLSLQESLFKEYGVYDLKFLPYHPIFAAATTVGRIVIFQLQQVPHEEGGQNNLQMKEIISHLVFADNIIIISIAWFPLQRASDETRIMAVTVEDGGVYLVRFNDEFKSYEILNHRAPLHEHVYKTPYFENQERVWSCAFSTPFPDRVFSGGDDNYLRVSTLNLPPTALEDIQERKNVQTTDDSLFGIKMAFSAGVTSILPLPIVESSQCSSILLVGSYDCHLRLCMMSGTSEDGVARIPSFSCSVDLALDGGVYRLRFLQPYSVVQTQEEVSFKVLACCMHAGAKILEVKRSMTGTWSISILAEVKDNVSMCYAADVQPLLTPPDDELPLTGNEKRICISSSWSDSKLSVWSFDPKAV
ncbi:hypothetical protein EG329_009675 [Mollisiaceae sp. DMI_Dod_QoI]|nr:hypothetical protein EG329_009675 [Helotiales sp. DMI_Dod_QoI]